MAASIQFDTARKVHLRFLSHGLFARFWPHILAVLSFLTSLLASIHAVLNKSDSRAAALWLGFIWLLPFAGPLLYLALGVNRIRRHALSLWIGRAEGDARVSNLPCVQWASRAMWW